MITVKYIDTIDGIKDLIFEQTYNAAIDRTRSSYFYGACVMLPIS